MAAGWVSVGDLAGSVGRVSVGDFPEATGRASGNDVAGGGSAVQAVRRSNRDRTPASRMFARERCAFKLAKSEKIILMAATLIPDYDGRKARMVPGDYQETQSRVQFNAMSVCLTMPGCDPMGSQVFSHKLLSKESLAAGHQAIHREA